ncbi:MAG: hypothetical protein KatS3mg030_725 [Saprospiraceae bacterium]|nr:MAG: hypothetical protein KatS3mg030_725 [Saprospiraceae bacterium]
MCTHHLVQRQSFFCRDFKCQSTHGETFLAKLALSAFFLETSIRMLALATQLCLTPHKPVRPQTTLPCGRQPCLVADKPALWQTSLPCGRQACLVADKPALWQTGLPFPVAQPSGCASPTSFRMLALAKQLCLRQTDSNPVAATEFQRPPLTQR